MPYDIVTKDGIRLTNIPDDMPKDAPELKALVAEERRGIKARAAREELKNAPSPEEEQARIAKEAAAEMGTGVVGSLKRGLANVGAGMDSAWQGAKQLVGAGEGDEAEADRRRIAAGLAENTTGGTALQILGEALPTAVIPGGWAGRVLPRALSGGARGVRGIAAEGAAAGAAGGALVPTLGDESRLANMALGTAGGAAGGAALGGAGQVLRRATGAGREGAALERQGGHLVERFGDTGATLAEREAAAAAAAQGIGTHLSGRLGQHLPVTAAQAAHLGGAPREAIDLATTELGVRGARAGEFGELANRQNQVLWGGVQDAGSDAANIAQLRIDRDAATAPLREAALQSAGRWSRVGQPLEADVAQITGGSAVGSGRRNIANYMTQVLGENPTPTQLYETRKMLAQKLAAPPALNEDAVTAAVRAAPAETMQVIRAIDARLNEASASRGLGQQPWSDYLNEYIARSRPLTSAKAQSRITEQLSPEGGRLVGGVPEVTRHKLSQALRAHGSNAFGDTLDPAARLRYDDIMGVMQGLEGPMTSVKLGGTAGGGSQTATQSALATGLGAAGASAGMPLVGEATRIAQRLGNQRMQQELAALMLNPQRAMLAIQAKLERNLPLTPAETAIRNMMATGAAVPGTAAAETAQ